MVAPLKNQKGSTMKNTNQENTTDQQAFCPVKCAVAQVAVTALDDYHNLADLKDLNTDMTLLYSTLAAFNAENMAEHEARALYFALNLVKDIATAKSIAIAQNH